MTAEEITVALGGQHWLARCPVLLIYAMDLASLMWKYPHGRTYRVGLLDAGHLSQTVLTCATALGLSTNFTAFFLEEELERHLGIGSGDQVIAGVCGVGYAETDDPLRRGIHD